jgi:membrane peptidoglycan carboxypeptidase
MPDGITDTLAGARVTGTIAGNAVIEVELDRLASVDLDRDGPPGTLAFAFPVLESCRTTADPPGIDLEALSGPYRHVFVAGGRRHDRVLAPGAPGFVPLSQASRIAKAFVALEDMRFRSHDGFDREQIERAFWHNLVAGGVRRGASTISQQTARNLWLGVDRSLARKLQEAWLTARLEATVDKDRILELYVNLIELGPGVFGIDEGARHHFGIDAQELDVLQALHLASLAPAPRTLSKRFASGHVDEAWLAELRDHARRMHRNGMISKSELMAAMHSELRLRLHTIGAASADAAP